MLGENRKLNNRCQLAMQIYTASCALSIVVVEREMEYIVGLMFVRKMFMQPNKSLDYDRTMMMMMILNISSWMWIYEGTKIKSFHLFWILPRKKKQRSISIAVVIHILASGQQQHFQKRTSGSCFETRTFVLFQMECCSNWMLTPTPYVFTFDAQTCDTQRHQATGQHTQTVFGGFVLLFHVDRMYEQTKNGS